MDEHPNWKRRLTATLDDIFACPQWQKFAAQLTETRKKKLIDYPSATYRLQFHKDFTFYDAIKIMPYLAKLGVSHVYASPYTKARPDSTHGYDIVDHNSINPQLGGDAGYAAYLQALKNNSLKQILDFVPNHTGIGGRDNAWWLNILEWGKASPYADYFDIDWQPRRPGQDTKLVVPTLGSHYGETLAKGELKLGFDVDRGSFSIWYGDHCFPVCPYDYHFIYNDVYQIGRNAEEGEQLKDWLRDNTHLHIGIQNRVQQMNNDRIDLHELLERQSYRLASWRVASSEINYRRFFDINELAGLRVEKNAVFDEMHKLVLAEIDKGNLHGIRLDHIDGVADPAGYCQRLRDKIGSDVYLTVEKIFGEKEKLRTGWQIEGSSGYDALNQIGRSFC